jgi:hypothetical protein
MSRLRGQRHNSNDAPVTPAAISVDSTTAVTLIPAPPSLEEPWFRISIYNDGNQILWLRFYTAATDNLKKGEPLQPGEKVVIELPNTPITEISGIMNSGGARSVYVQYI